MKFDKLRLTGFKSFVEQTDVVIEAGLTGVVGPNGCGKSNLVEALRWAMGEASYKSVRGSSMDDVIFAGSGRRPMRDTAEVTLFIDNRDRSAPAEIDKADHLEITRRITRALGSDYRVNGKSVRARDVQLLFADAATGSRSPSMVRQGQVAELIAAKPTDRRHILEEAAGVAGLRARKHEALLKLNAAEQNLSRVEDVSAEVERQIETLRKQARQAHRYKAVAAEIRTLEATVHHLRWVEAGADVRTAAAAVTAARAATGEAGERQARTATDQAAAEHGLPALREAEAAVSAARERIASALHAVDVREKEIAARLATLGGSVAGLEKDLARQDGAKADAAAAVARLAAEADGLSRQNAGADDRLAALDSATRRCADEAEAADRHALGAAERAAAVLAAREAANATVSRAAAQARSAAAERDRIRNALAEAARSGAVAGREAAAVAVTAAEADEARASGALCAAEAVLPAIRASEADGREALARAAAAVAERETEAKALARLTATVATSDAVLDACRVAAGYETAFAVALGDDLNAPVSATAALRWTANPGEDAPLPAGATPLSTLVEAPVALARRLAQVGVVEAADGPRLQAALGTGQRLVSTGGAFWRWDGFAQDAGAPSAAAERLAQRNRLAALEAELAEHRPARGAAAAAATAASEALRDAAASEAAARTALQAARKAMEGARSRLAANDARAREAENTRTRLAAALEAAEARHTATAEALGAAEAERAAASAGEAEAAARDDAKRAAAHARQAAASARDKADAERRAVVGRSRRLERIAVELADWRGRLDGADGHRSDLSARLLSARAERDRLADLPAETGLERRRLATAAREAEGSEAAARDARAEAERLERDARAAARQALDTLSQAREAAARAEERYEAARTRLATVEHDLADALGVRPEGAARLAGLASSAPLPDRAGAETRLDRLKSERERIGGVNLLAEQELAEIEERRGMMLAERDDLVAAIGKLRTGILALDKEARGRLVASLDTVDREFRRLFTHLFGGGEASLVLTEADDPLEAGLDILARPPGKKPQSLSLLSGGEQTLTATALIFAVFLTNPAPISVLDEIDAPLDDANVERFCNLLDEMTRLTDTRFLIITHNPITMARMHRLYGVTMIERGVSQLVSVTLEAAESLREMA